MMEKSVMNKKYDRPNNNDNESLELYTINTQSSSSKPRQWRDNLANSVKQRGNILKYTKSLSMGKLYSLSTKPFSSSKALIGRDESLIRVYHHNHYLRSLRNKRDKHKEIITINVSGNRYETRLSTLENYPNTLLGNQEKRKYYWNNENQEYYFDRHRACFEVILYYYQSNGRLRRPNYIPLDTFIEEILFFDLGPQALSQINKFENISIIKYIDLPNCLWRRYIWFYFEYPQNSILARIIFFISMFFTILSCIALAIETLPEYNEKYNINICQNQTENSTSSSDDLLICSALISSPFFIIQTICVSFFTIEFLLRLISTPSYYRFLLSIFNWIDLCAIIPYFIHLGIILGEKQLGFDRNILIIFRIFRVFRFLRVFQIYLIFKQFKSLRVLASTLKESFVEFIIMMIILTLIAFLYGTALFFAEQDVNGDVFDSIPKATYWGIVTITAVGYGDMYPVTVAGRILTCICAFFGLGVGGMLVSVLVERYQRVYNRKQFLPEQIISAVDSSDGEQNEKQDFINRRLSGTRKTLSGGPILPPIAASPVISPNNDRKYSEYNSSSSYIRFIITITEDQTDDNSMYDTANELMTQLTEAIESSGEKVNLKLISADADFSTDQRAILNELSLIAEE